MRMKIELVYLSTYLCVVLVLPAAWRSLVVVERLNLTTFIVDAEWKPICMNPSFSDFDVHLVGISFCTEASLHSLNS